MTEHLGRVCREAGTALAFGMLERGDDGHAYNSLVFLDKRGAVVPGFVAAANRGGTEDCGGQTSDYFGRSCIVAPDGSVLAEAPPYTQPVVLRAELDLGLLEGARKEWPVWQDRRPELYRFMYT